MRAAATAEATDMDTRWDGLLVNARLVTLAGDAGYGVIHSPCASTRSSASDAGGAGRSVR